MHANDWVANEDGVDRMMDEGGSKAVKSVYEAMIELVGFRENREDRKREERRCIENLIILLLILKMRNTT